MPNDFKIDLYRSTYTRGISHNRYDRATRYGIVRDLTPGTLGELKTAVDVIQQSAGSFHHLDTTLPLQHITATQFCPTKAWVTLQYGRVSSSISQSPPGVLATWDSGEWQAKAYFRSNGKVEYDRYYVSGDKQPKYSTPKEYARTHKAYVIQVPTILAFNPAGAVWNNLSTTNSNVFEIGGFDFPVNCLRFDGIRIRSVETSSGVDYYTNYQLTAVEGDGGGFKEEFADAESGDWLFTSINSYEQSAFGFPY